MSFTTFCDSTHIIMNCVLVFVSILIGSEWVLFWENFPWEHKYKATNLLCWFGCECALLKKISNQSWIFSICWIIFSIYITMVWFSVVSTTFSCDSLDMWSLLYYIPLFGFWRYSMDFCWIYLVLICFGGFLIYIVYCYTVLSLGCGGCHILSL